MEQILFICLGVGALASGIVVVLGRNPVVSVVNLVFTFFFLGGIFLLLGFPFMWAIQILVYTGAILVLFLFVILLLDLRREEFPPPRLRMVLAPSAKLYRPNFSSTT